MILETCGETPVFSARFEQKRRDFSHLLHHPRTSSVASRTSNLTSSPLIFQTSTRPVTPFTRTSPLPTTLYGFVSYRTKRLSFFVPIIICLSSGLSVTVSRVSTTVPNLLFTTRLTLPSLTLPVL